MAETRRGNRTAGEISRGRTGPGWDAVGPPLLTWRARRQRRQAARRRRGQRGGRRAAARRRRLATAEGRARPGQAAAAAPGHSGRPGPAPPSPRHVRGGTDGVSAPLSLSEEAGGEGPQAGACEAVQLLQDLHLLLVHLREQRRSATGEPRFPSPGPLVHPMPDTTHSPQPQRIPHLLPLGFRVVPVAKQVAQSVGRRHLRGGREHNMLLTEPHARPTARQARAGLTVRTSSKSSPVSRHCWWMYSTPRKMSPRL